MMMYWEDWKFRRQLQRLQKAKSGVEADFAAQVATARASGNHEEEQQAASLYFHERDLLGEKIHLLQHRHTVSQAEQLLIPVPVFSTKSSDWIQSDLDGRWRLSVELLAELAKDVRRERRERMEFFFLLPISFLGLVGGALGVAAFIFTYLL